MQVHTFLSVAFIIASAISLTMVATYPLDITIGNGLTGYTVMGGSEFCEDGTVVGACSGDIGNKCVMERDGPKLRFSEDCYR
jgi:hypothetical protein